MLEFMNPWWLCLLVLLPIYLYYYLKYILPHRLTIPYSRFDIFSKLKLKNHWSTHLNFLLRILALLFLILALGRPRLAISKRNTLTNGINIVFCIDNSGSMHAIDFKPRNRLEAAKKVAIDFIRNRKNDQIGIVTFSEYAFTQCPLTLDYNIVLQIMNDLQINEDLNGTAIGMGIATSVARLKESKAKSKVIILITDGRNNAGEVDPFSAAQLAATYGIKVYAIGVGSTQPVDFPIPDPFLGVRYQKVKIDIDMNTLNTIAQITGTGFARLAQNTDELQTVIRKIDQMEKTKIKIKNYYDYIELMHYFLLISLLAVLLEFLFRTRFRIELP